MPNVDEGETLGREGVRETLSGRVGFGKKPVVLVVDEQWGMTDPACPLGSNLDGMVENSAVLLHLARAEGIPIVFTVAAFRPDLSDAGIFWKKIPAVKHQSLGTRWVELDDRLPYDPERDYLLPKKMPSGFVGTPLLSILAYHQADTIVVLGCSTSGCVRASVQDGLAYGYRMMIPRECVGDRLAQAHESSLFDMDAMMGDVVSMQEVLDYFNRLQ
ncbi:isochorismatase family protein [Chloroflexota bacterium]